jgi:hypothetical protein
MGSGPWYWYCYGQNGGNTACCSAQKTAPTPINGSCGSSNGSTFNTAPTTNLCNTGLASSVSGSGPWYWTCNGQNGGTTSSCSANKTALTPINGSCGSSNAGTFNSAPTTNLCNAGTFSGMSGVGPWYWSCYGQNGGNNVSCSANKTAVAGTDGQCGSSHTGTFDVVPTTNLCNAGTFSGMTGSGPWYWNCYGQNGGNNVSCYANKTAPAPINGTCGSSSAGTFDVVPSTNLCSTGTFSGMIGAGPWYWSCYGQNGGNNSSCYANKTQIAVTNGQCGAAHNNIFDTAPDSSLLCLNGLPSSLIGTGPWYWTCNGQNGGITVNCLANKTAPSAINGACGSSHTGTFDVVPTTNLCNAGTFSGMTGSGPWYWNCYGQNGGNNVSCYANKTAVAGTNGVCGSSNGGTFDIVPTTNLCNAGTFSGMSGVGPWYWSCYGQNGGNNVSCSANKTAVAGTDGQCGSSHTGTFDVVPTTNLCNAGTFSGMTGSGPWYWNCYGQNGGNNVSCYANKTAPAPINGTCGSSSAGTFDVVPSTNLCSTGTFSGMIGAGPWYWSCYGQNGGNNSSCYANKTQIAVTNGQCGAAHNNIFDTAPDSSLLCLNGLPSSLIGTGPWYWTCNGQNGGITVNCLANKTAPSAINGACGSSHTGTFDVVPTTNLCNAGTFSGMTGSGPWYWNCYGQNGGNNVSCYANKTAVAGTNGVCGSSNGGTFDIVPTTNLCNAGTFSGMSGVGPWYWSCYGQNGGNNVSCSANKTAVAGTDGQCGSANGSSYNTAPTESLCNAGTFSGMSGTGPWYWNCYGINGGNNVSCSANKISNPINGQCGYSNGQTFEYAPTTNLCNAGTFSGMSGSGPWYWTCYGSDGGNNVSCSANKTQINIINGQCGSANGQTYEYIPSSSLLCSSGFASSVSGYGPWYWTCNGQNGGTTASCSANKTTTYQVSGQCGYSNGQTFEYAPTTNLCNAGTFSGMSGSGPWYWTCYGTSGGMNASCSANKTTTYQVSGQCGYSNGQTFEYAPTTNLCNAGTFSGMSGSGPWYWTCYGTSGGMNASCSANKTTTYQVSGQCGYSNGQTFEYAPTTNLCNAGTFSGMSGSGPWYWTCYGTSGGMNASCSANKTTTTYQNLAVATWNATDIKTTSATLNGQLDGDNGQYISVRFGYGRYDNLGYYTQYLTSKRAGQNFSSVIYSLEKGKAYSFRAEATNNSGSTVYGNTLKFITNPDSPYNFNAYATTNGVNLVWTPGAGACYTVITKKLYSYPISATDGSIAYFGTGSSYFDSEVSQGVTYYYRAWSLGCDQGLYSWSDSVYTKKAVKVPTAIIPTTIIQQPVSQVPVVVQPRTLSLQVTGRNSSLSCSGAMTSVVSAEPGDIIDVVISVSSVDGKALENVILSNILPEKIGNVSNVQLDGQPYVGDVNGTILLGNIKANQTKKLSFTLSVAAPEFFSTATTLSDNAEVNAKNIETVRGSLAINVSAVPVEEEEQQTTMAAVSLFAGGWWNLLWLIIGLIVGLILFFIIYLIVKKITQKEQATLALNRDKYFTIQQ